MSEKHAVVLVHLKWDSKQKLIQDTTEQNMKIFLTEMHTNTEILKSWASCQPGSDCSSKYLDKHALVNPCRLGETLNECLQFSPFSRTFRTPCQILTLFRLNL